MAEAQQPAIRRTRGWFLLLAALIGFFSNIGNAPLFDLDEGAFTEATREMLTSGNWVLPTLNGEPRYDKPILIYWLQGASVKLFGFNEGALRLPSALCALLWMFAIFTFARRNLPDDPPAATIAALAVPLGLMSSIVGHAATADALLNLLLTLSLFDLYQWLRQPSRILLLRTYLWIGLGLLAKGPIALLLPVAVSLPYALWQGQFRQWLRGAFDPIGWAVLLGVVLPWVIKLWSLDGGDFLRHFLLDQNVGRYASTMQGHGGHIWYYAVWLWAVIAPFSLALIPTLGASVKTALRERAALDGYLLWWFAVVFVVFSFSATQLPHYLLYGCSPLFVLLGRWRARFPARIITLLPALLLTGLFAALPWLLPKIPLPLGHEFERGIIDLAVASFDTPYKALTFAAAAIVLVLMAVPRLSASRALPIAAFAQTVAVWYAVAPVLAAAQQQPVREAALRARELGLPVVSYHTWMPSFSVYRGAITPERVPHPGELVFVRLDRVAGLQDAIGREVLVPEFRKGGVALFQVAAAPKKP
jgi:4-amino-4-deoxy-L-arabinose transferase-like glycosyltransferase